MKNIDYIKSIQDIYDKRASIPFDGSTYHTILCKDLKLLLTNFPYASKPILDIGCGTGWHLEYMMKSGYNMLTGIDLSKKSLAKFQERINSNIKLINNDFITYNFTDKYDCVTNFNSCFGQYGDVNDKAFIKKVFSVLNVNGVFILTIFTTNKSIEIEGSYEAKYSKYESNFVSSKIHFDKNTNHLIIFQTYSTITITEEIKLYSEIEIIKLLEEARFRKVKIIDNHSGYYSTFVGQK